jgi:hypothetical protein
LAQKCFEYQCGAVVVSPVVSRSAEAVDSCEKYPRRRLMRRLPRPLTAAMSKQRMGAAALENVAGRNFPPLPPPEEIPLRKAGFSCAPKVFPNETESTRDETIFRLS